MPRQERRRAKSALVTILFSIVILVAPLVAMAMAQSEPRIAFLNPSDYSAGASEAPLVVSDRKTGSDEEDSVNESTYRLSAYTANAPSGAIVEFEVDITTELGSILTQNIGVADQVSSDAFEFNWDSSSIPDGTYTLRAILYSGSGVTGTEIARAEQDVLVNNSNTSAAADIVYPVNGDPTGFYVNPLTGSTNSILIIEFSAGTSNVRVFYTVTDPGVPPVWKPCTGATFSGVGGDTQAQNPGQITLRCVLQSIDQGATSVTGLGVVANNSQQRSYNQNLNQAGDAIRALPYKQDAASATVDAPTVRANGSFSGGSELCSPAQFVTILDQNGKPIGGMNVDVHAYGPNDQLRFNSGGLFSGPPSSNSPPNKAHTGIETAYNCGDIPPNGFPGEQGDHNIAGAPDIKHVEGSTSNTGAFGWNFNSTSNGTTQVTVWADEDDDDQFCDDEASSVASVGWNEPAPAPVGETAIVSECPIPVPPPPSDGTDSPSPTDTGPDPSDCTIEGTDGDDVIRGTEGNDVICAGAGDDDIEAYGGDDIVRGESGNDIIQGDEGDDTIDGGTGNDRIDGGFDNDTIDGTAGSDVLLGGAGNDVLRGQASVDGMQGGSGKDVIQGGGGDDVADGQSGADIMKGYNGEDILRGGNGADTIKGMNMNDQLTGGGGADKISGGSGRDQCSGGSGRDKLRQCES